MMDRFTPGAKAVGMGYSGVVENYDLSALFWNPAALSVRKSAHGYISIHEPFKMNYAGYAHFVPRWGTFAAAIGATWHNAQPMHSATLGWGHELAPHFSFGININGYEQHKQSSSALSIGMLYRPTRSIRSVDQLKFSQSPYLADRLSIGLALYNIPLGQQLSQHQIRFAVSYKMGHAGPSLVYAHHFSSQEDTDHLGLLLNPTPHAHVYTGILNFDIRQFSFGGGFEWNNIEINVTYDVLTKRLVVSSGFRIGEHPQKMADRYYKQAIEALRQRDKKQALRLCELAYIYDKNNSAAYNLEIRLQPFIERENQKIDSLLVTARSFENQGIFLSAAAQYLKILKIDPRNDQARDAIAMIRPRVNLDVERWYQQAVEAYNDGNIERAKELFEAIKLVRPDHFGSKNYLVKIQSYYSKMAEQHFYAGLGYYSQRKLDLAEAEFDKALTIDPNVEEASEYISRIKIERTQNRRQISNLLAEAQQYEANQAWRSALDTYREILKIQPDYTLALKKQQELGEFMAARADQYFNRGKNAYDNSDARQALRHFDMALSLNPSHALARQYKNSISTSQSGQSRRYIERARAFAEQGNWQQTIVMADSALALEASHVEAAALKNEATRQLDVETLMQQAQTVYFAGRFLDALHLFNAVLKKDPQNADAKRLVENCQAELNSQVDEIFSNGIQLFTEDKYQEAINLLDTVLKINPYHKGALNYKRQAQERLDIIENLP